MNDVTPRMKAARLRADVRLAGLARFARYEGGGLVYRPSGHAAVTAACVADVVAGESGVPVRVEAPAPR